MALSWCFEDEAQPETDALLEQVRDAGAVLPAVWHLEFGTVLVQGERRGRLSAADTTPPLELIAELSTATDDGASGSALHAVVALAHTASLTTDDVAYLELAMRQGLPLATKDKALGHGLVSA